MWKQSVRLGFRFFLVGASLVIFFRTLFDKERGLVHARVLKKDIAALNDAIKIRKKEVAVLESYLASWERDPFFKERVIRESLLMGRGDEKIYVLEAGQKGKG